MSNIWTWQPSKMGELYHYGVMGMKWGVRRARSHERKGDRIISKSSGPSDDYDDYPNATKNATSKPFNKAAKHYEKASTIRSSIDKRATKKLNKLNARFEKRQAKADKKFDKAERKANSLFASKRSAERAFRKASKAQFKANKAALKGKKWYEQMEKSYKKANISMTKENQEIGKEMVRQVRANARAMYAATYVRG